MFKSVNVSTFILARNSLLIQGFPFTSEDFLLSNRLLSQENGFITCSHTFFMVALQSSAPPLLRTGRDDTERSIMNGAF